MEPPMETPMETPTSWPNNVGRSPGAGPPRTVAAAAALVGVLVAGSLVTAALGQSVNTTPPPHPSHSRSRGCLSSSLPRNAPYAISPSPPPSTPSLHHTGGLRTTRLERTASLGPCLCTTSRASPPDPRNPRGEGDAAGRPVASVHALLC